MTATVSTFLRANRGLLLFLFLMLVFRSALADWNEVPTSSMRPTIIEGDRIIVDKLAYDLRVPLLGSVLQRRGEPARGDIVVFDSSAAGVRLVKRVIGLPGDRVALVDNRLVVNGVPADYQQAGTDTGAPVAIERLDGLPPHRVRWSGRGGGRLSRFGPVTVPDDHYLVLGDNRDDSADSRVHGLVPRSELIGRASTVALSFDYERWHLPRSGRWWQPLDPPHRPDRP
jgi:signal peptidase I